MTLSSQLRPGFGALPAALYSRAKGVFRVLLGGSWDLVSDDNRLIKISEHYNPQT